MYIHTYIQWNIINFQFDTTVWCATQFARYLFHTAIRIIIIKVFISIGWTLTCYAHTPNIIIHSSSNLQLFIYNLLFARFHFKILWLWKVSWKLRLDPHGLEANPSNNRSIRNTTVHVNFIVIARVNMKELAPTKGPQQSWYNVTSEK